MTEDQFLTIEQQFLNAVCRGNYQKVKEFVKNGVDINTQSKDGYTALIYAASSDDIKTAKLLIKNGADLNIQTSDDYERQTALLIASEDDESRVFKLILDAKPDIELKNVFGCPVLYDVLHLQHFRQAEDLIKAGAKTDELLIVKIADLDDEDLPIYLTQEMTIRDYIDAHVNKPHFSELISLIEKVELEKMITTEEENSPGV